MIEINPRFPGYLRFPSHCGLDLPLLAARLALGDAPTARRPAYRVEQRYVAPTLFTRTLRDDVRVHGVRVALRKARTDLRGSGRAITGMFDDPLPLIARMLTPDPSLCTPPSRRGS